MSTLNCDNTYVQVAIPGSGLSAKNYSSICFRVGGENCCYPFSPNAFSNTVCKPLLTNPCCAPPDPPNPVRCLNKDDLSGLIVIVSYDPSSCDIVHRSNNAIFLLYINDIKVGEVNLNNAEDGAAKSVALNIPFGIIMQDNSYKISIIKHPSVSIAYKGTIRLEILDENADIIFDECLPTNSETLTTTCGPNNDPLAPFEPEVQNGQIDSIYSLKHKLKEYSGPVVRLRRSNDNAESDFYSEDIYNGSAENWVGENNDGYIKTWYDQNTLNNLNIIQPDPDLQLRFIKNGKISVINNIDPEPMSGFVGAIEEYDGSELISLEEEIGPNRIMYTKLTIETYTRLDGSSGCRPEYESKLLSFEGSHVDSCTGYIYAAYSPQDPPLRIKNRFVTYASCGHFYKNKWAFGFQARGYSLSSSGSGKNFNIQTLEIPEPRDPQISGTGEIPKWMQDKVKAAREQVECLEDCRKLNIVILGQVFVP